MAYVGYPPARGTTTHVAFEARPHQVDHLRFEVPATADRLAQIRRRLLAWLQPLGVPEAAVSDIVLAVNEACTNSVEHAYRNTDGGTIKVEASIVGDDIVVCITDHGSWRTPSGLPSTRGRGLPIIEATSDHVELMRSTSGTTVQVTFHTARSGQECGSRTT